MKKTATSLLFTVVFFAGCGGDPEPAATETASQQTANRPGLLSTDAATDSNPPVTESDVRPATTVGDEGMLPDSNATAETGSAAESGLMRNGLFPQMDGVASSNGRFGGALFPDFMPGQSGPSSDATSTPAGSDSDPFDLGDQFFASQSVSDESADDGAAYSVQQEISLLPQARRLFEQHRGADAAKLLYANYLVSDQCREDYSLEWYPGLKEPRLFFRWGLGVIYKQPRDFEGRHPVIGDPGDENENVSSSGGQSSRDPGRRGGLGFASSGGGAAGGARGSRAYKNVDTSRPDGFVLYYTGDFGDRLISFLEQRRIDEDKPHYGQILKDVMEAALPEDEQEENDSTVPRGRARLPGGRGSRPPSSGIVSALQGGPNGGVRGGNVRGGDRGSGTSDATSPDAPVISILDRALGSTTAQKPEDETEGSVIPGVMLVGAGSKAQLIERALAAELDSLIIFNVRISQSRRSSWRNRSGPTRFNTTSLRIVDLQDDRHDTLFNSKPLKDTDVEESGDESEDPVTEQVERAFETLADKLFRGQPLPDGLNSSNVGKRVERLLQKPSSNPLPAAVEVIGYLEREFLSQEDAIAALNQLFDSPDAAVLVNGTAAQRLEFVSRWLPDDTEI